MKDRNALLSFLSLHCEHFSSSLPPFIKVCLKNECLGGETGKFLLDIFQIFRGFLCLFLCFFDAEI